MIFGAVNTIRKLFTQNHRKYRKTKSNVDDDMYDDDTGAIEVKFVPRIPVMSMTT